MAAGAPDGPARLHVERLAGIVAAYLHDVPRLDPGTATQPEFDEQPGIPLEHEPVRHVGHSRTIVRRWGRGAGERPLSPERSGHWY